MSIVVTKQFKFEKFLLNVERYGITHLQIVPPIAVLLSKHPATNKHTLSSVRYCMVAAAPISAELSCQLLQLLPGIHFGQGYGMTETCAAVSMVSRTDPVLMRFSRVFVSSPLHRKLGRQGALAN
jgi:4-coumarate--CoA ligase